MMLKKSDMSVIVVGAGPVGLLTALRIAKEGIRVKVLEALPAVEESPRAMAYQPIAVKELDRAGILEDVRKIGGSGKVVSWRKTSTGEEVARLERIVTAEHPYENLIIGQHELAGVILEHLQRNDSAEVRWNSKVVSIDQNNADGVVVTTEGTNGAIEKHSADYLVGADGGRSSVRKLMGIEFEGFTYKEQLCSTNVYYEFDHHGWSDANFCM
jgi:2-polyprenyl-6-methoxyphenol hydroxylase-like FAD-dependent oxidoreductase